MQLKVMNTFKDYRLTTADYAWIWVRDLAWVDVNIILTIINNNNDINNK